MASQRFFRAVPAGMLAAALVSGLVSLSACRQGPSREALLEQAAQAMAQRNPAAAAIHLKTALQKGEDAHVRFLLAQAYLDMGDYAAAEKELRRTRDLDASIAQVGPLVVRAMFEQKAFKRLVDETRAAAAAGALDPVSLSYRAMALLALGRVEQAEEALRNALQAAPDLPAARLGEARLAFARGDFAKALAVTDEVLGKQPRDLDALLTKAELLSLSGKRDAAITAYRAVLAAHPKNVPAHLRLATLFAETRQFDEAERQVTALRAIAPANPMADYLSASILYQRKDLAGARQRIEAVNRELPALVPGMVPLGMIEVASGAPQAAVAPLTAAIRLAPDHLLGRALLARALLADRRPQQAYDVLRPGLDIAPNAPELLALAGEALLYSNEPRRAAQMLERAAQLAPKDSRVLRNLAWSRWAGGDADAGLAALVRGDAAADAKAGDAGKDDPALRWTASLLRVLREVDAGRLDQAEQQAAALARERPQDAVARNLLGGVLARRGKMAEARQAFEAALAADPVHYPALVNLGLLDLQQNQRDVALARFDAILAKQPDHLSALLGKAVIGMKANLPSEQIAAWLERARRAHPRSLAPAVLAARVHEEAGQTGAALEAARQAYALAPREPEVLHVLGTTQLLAKEPAAAVATFTQWVAIEPDSALPLVLLAQAQVAEGRSIAAMQSAARALGLAPRSPEVRAEAARVALAAGREDEAAQQLAALQKLNPPPALAYELEGDLLRARNDPSKAAEAYRRALSTAPGTRIFSKLVVALQAAGRSEEALTAGAEWLKQRPGDVAARFIVAQVATQAGRMQEAASQYEAILSQRGEDAGVLNNLAAAYVHFDPPRAVEAARKAQRLAPNDPYVVDTYGWALVKSGQVAEGVRWIEKAHRAAPDNAEIAYHYAAGLAKSGDAGAARVRLEQLLAGKPQFAEAAEARALLQSLAPSGRP